MAEIKRIKRDPVSQVNKKSNQDQYKANKAVEDAQAALEKRDLEKTKEALDKGVALLQERQKVILLADKSPFGWNTVLEYKHHDLADDEEDEKKIYRFIERNRGRPEQLSHPPDAQFSNDEDLFLPFKPSLPSSQLPSCRIFSHMLISSNPSKNMLLVFVLRVENLATGELGVPFCSRRMPCSLPSDSPTLSLTRISTFTQWINHRPLI